MTGRLAQWRDATDLRMDASLDATAAAASVAGDFLDELTGPLADAARAGKRLRALLLLASHDAHGGDDSDIAVDIAAALELFQTAALLHDDVLDDSDTRRGMPAAHRRIAALHRGAAWTGDPDAFGAAGGVLAGDLALMSCQRLVARAAARLGPDRGPQVSDLFASMADLVTAGQYADMRAAAQPISTLGEQYDAIVSVMRSKTASYTCEHPLALGAAIAGAGESAISAAREIGVDLGLAFQMRDDVLGLVGTPEVTGKPAGDDVREGKRTLVMWRAWNSTDDAGRSTLASTLGVRDADDAAVARVIDVVRATDALEWCEQRIHEHASTARVALAEAGLAGRGTSELESLIDSAVARSA